MHATTGETQVTCRFVFIQGPRYASCTRSLPQGLGCINCHRGCRCWAGDLNKAVCVLPSPSRPCIDIELNHILRFQLVSVHFYHITIGSIQIIMQRSLDGLGAELHSEVSRAGLRFQD